MGRTRRLSRRNNQYGQAGDLDGGVAASRRGNDDRVEHVVHQQ